MQIMQLLQIITSYYILGVITKHSIEIFLVCLKNGDHK